MKSFLRGSLKAALMGAIVGLIMAVGFVFTFSVTGAQISSVLATAMFMLVGAATGIVFSTALYFISREKSPTISRNDLDHNEAMIIITLKDKALGRLRRILTSYNVEKIYRT